MIGLTGHPSTSSERTVKPSLPRLKWVAFLTQQNPINITMTAPLRLIFVLLLSLGIPLSSLAQNDNSVVALLTLTPPPAQSAPVIQHTRLKFQALVKLFRKLRGINQREFQNLQMERLRITRGRKAER